MSVKTILCFTPKCQDILVHIIDAGTFKEEIQIFSLLNLKDELPQLPVDTVIGVLFRFTANEIEEKSKLAKLLEEYYGKRKIMLVCCSWNSIFISSLIMAYTSEYNGEFTPEGIFCIITCEEDKIIIIHAGNSKSIPNDGSFEDYYFLVSTTVIPSNRIKKDLIKIVQGIKVYVTCQRELHLLPVTKEQKDIQNLVEIALKPMNVTIINKSVHEFICQAICYKVFKLFNAFHTPFDVASNGFYSYAIAPLKENINELTHETFKKCLVTVSALEGIPFYNMIVCYQKFENLLFLKTADQSMEIETLEKFSVNELGTSLLISIDKFYAHHLMIEKDNKQIKSGAIINLKENKFSVEIIKNGKLIDIGVNDVPLEVWIANGQAYYIGKDVQKIKNKRDSFVIPNLLNLLILNTSNVKINPKSGVKIIKDQNGKIVLEFGTPQGRKKVEPSFIFSFILQWSIKQAKANLKQMPQLLVISTKLLNDELKSQLMESCTNAKLPIKNIQIQRYKIAEIDFEIKQSFYDILCNCFLIIWYIIVYIFEKIFK